MEALGNIVINKLDTALFATIQTALTPDVLEQFKSQLLDKVSNDNVSFVIVDFSGLELLDAEECYMLQSICKMIVLMGAKSIWVGLNPGIACSIDDFNVDLSHIGFASDIDDALFKVNNGK